MVDPRAVVWRGDTSLPRGEQGLVILGAPVGQVEFVKAQLEKKEAEHSENSVGRQSPSCMVVARLLRRGARQFHHAHCESRIGRSICHGPSRTCPISGR